MVDLIFERFLLECYGNSLSQFANGVFQWSSLELLILECRAGLTAGSANIADQTEPCSYPFLLFFQGREAMERSLQRCHTLRDVVDNVSQRRHIPPQHCFELPFEARCFPVIVCRIFHHVLTHILVLQDQP